MMLLSFQSSFSPLEGIYTPQEIYAAIDRSGYSSVLIADTNNLYGIAGILRLRRDVHLRVHCGVLIKYSSGEEILSLLAIPVDGGGFKNLFRLLSILNTEKGLKRDDFIDAVRENSSGLIFVVSDYGLLREFKGAIDLFFGLNFENLSIYPLVKGLGVRPIVFRNTVFLSEDDVETGIVLRCISQRKRFDELMHMSESLKRSILLPPGVLIERYSHIRDAIDNLDYLEQLLEGVSFRPEFVLPGHDIEGASERLERLALDGARLRYPVLTGQILSRLRYELDVIARKNYSGYFLVVHDIVKQTSLTCGRGSAAASLVSYCLGITNVDPIRHNLMFERFLNPERSDPPDIDVDFAWDEREKIIEYIFNKYPGRVAQVSNHNRMTERLAIRDVARVFGLTERQIDELTGILEPLLEGERGAASLDEEECREIAGDPAIERILRIAKRVYLNLRYISTHCGGVVITPRDIREFAPVEVTGGDRLVIQWDKDDIEEIGLVKIDILGNRSLGVIRDAIDMIRRNYGIDLKKRHIIPEEDELTEGIIRDGKTLGVFYIESPAMRQLQKKAGVADFEHLVIHTSIIRPAANRYINEYVERLRGKPYKPLHPALENLLSETYGIMCYQEDVMKVAMEIAGFNYEEADRLRKTLSKKDRGLRIGVYKERFFEGGLKRGVEISALKEIWEMIESFGGYSFCKPHSASYVQVSFMSAFIKAHFPAEFIAAVIGNKGGYYSTYAYVSEGKRMGLRIHPPDINISGRRAYGCGDSVWLGFEDISSLKSESMDMIIEERERNGYFQSFEEFMRRLSGIPFSDLRLLILSGAFDRLCSVENRPNLLFKADILSKPGSRFSLFRRGGEGIEIPPYSRERLVELEYSVFGFPLTIHPLERFRSLFEGRPIVKARDMAGYLNRYVVMAGILITEKPVLTRQNEVMEFLTFEDETDIFEVTLFPKAYRKNRKALSGGNVFLLKGRVEDDHGAIYLNCNSLESLRLTSGKTKYNPSTLSRRAQI